MSENNKSTEKGIVVAVMVPHPPLIVPEVGRGGEVQVQKTIDAYHEAVKCVAEYQPDTVIVLSPHQTMYADYFHISPGKHAKGSFASFRASRVKFDVEYDTEFVENLTIEAELADIPAGTLGEREKNLDHGTMVPLYFLNQYYHDYKLVRIGLSGLPLLTHYRLGQCIQTVAEYSEKRIAIIASGDLSHCLKEDGPYGFRKEGPVYEERIMDVMSRASFGELFDFTDDFCAKAGECGHRSFTIMAGCLDRRAVDVKCLSHEGVTGVGYGICTYQMLDEDDKRDFGDKRQEKEQKERKDHLAKEDAYVRFARMVIESYIGEGIRPEVPQDLPEEMYHTRAGAFVSIKEDGKLRGCIGTIAATRDNLAEEILENAISASTRDPRFSPIEAEELNRLIISVDVLSEAEDIESAEQMDVKRYGVIVTKGRKRGLLLPNLDGVDTVEEQILIAKQKAGIREDEKVQLQRFEVVRHD